MSVSHVISQEDAMSRIAEDYIEMPDLKLTLSQARRLWNMPEAVAVAALASLVARGFLLQTRDGAYLRRASGAPTPMAKAS